MRKTLAFVTLLFTASAPALAQATNPGQPLRLTVDDAVQLALDHNVNLAVARLDPQIGDTRVAAAAGTFKPSLNTGVLRNNQLQPPASLLLPVATRNDVVTSSLGVGQSLPRWGTSYNLSWNSSHTDSNSFLNSYNPLITSGLGLTVSQPLLKNFLVDTPRTQLKVAQINRDITDTRLRESEVQTIADVKSAYWNLVSAHASVEARQTSLQLAEELARVNHVKVEVGQSPPLDEVSAQAEVASDQEQLIIAETGVRLAEDRLRMLIFDPTDLPIWNVVIDPVDTPPDATTAVDLDAAVSRALDSRTDIARAKKDVETAQVNVKLADNQRLPDVRVAAGYQTAGLGGTEIIRSGGFPGTVVGPGIGTPFSTILNQLVTNQYPTWTAGVSLSYPLGHSVQDADYARTELERKQSAERVKTTEAQAIQQVRTMGWNIEMNARRIETTRAARALAEQRFDAERKRFDVGMSTSFLVIQAQRDLTQARTNELSAVLAYDLALVQFDAVQQAPPSVTAAVTAVNTGATAIPGTTP